MCSASSFNFGGQCSDNRDVGGLSKEVWFPVLSVILPESPLFSVAPESTPRYNGLVPLSSCSQDGSGAHPGFPVSALTGQRRELGVFNL